MPAESADQSLNVRPEYSIEIVAILVIKNFRESIPQIERYLSNLERETQSNRCTCHAIHSTIPRNHGDRHMLEQGLKF